MVVENNGGGGSGIGGYGGSASTREWQKTFFASKSIHSSGAKNIAF